jgi:CheY-like chemotaxis protein
LNLAVNARDAMPDGGKLTIETGNSYLDENYVGKLPEPVAAGQYVMIAVTDTGFGMDSSTVEHAFEPFFTTKEVGKGTGLGLSQVYGFIRQSSGHVRIYSEPGNGTTVTLYLPHCVGDAGRPEPSLPRASAPAPGKGETILVVEDNDDLRTYSTGAIAEMGYAVLEAATGSEALSVLDSAGEVALLFTDVVLPGGMNGRQLADEALRRRPSLKVLYTTGYARNAIVHNGQLDPDVQLIGKPFTPAELAGKLRAVLDAA